MLPCFIHFRIIDGIDILLVALLMYQVYFLIKGTVAFNIFIAIISVWLLFILVKLFDMKLLTSILGAMISGGVIALIIVYQQEIRRFLIFLGSRYLSNRRFSLDMFLKGQSAEGDKLRISSIQKACANMAKTKTGALIVVSRQSALDLYLETGDILNANLSSRLLESIFFKNSPLHDGGVILKGNTVLAARCVLPFTSKTEVPADLGMRHRAGLGISEATDAFVIIISEERGKISVAENGRLTQDLSESELWHLLSRKFIEVK